MRLDAGKKIEARDKDMDYVREMNIWRNMPRDIARSRGWKVIQTRWIEIKKGDDQNPICRSRLVGKKPHIHRNHPLEALRCIVHEAATMSHGVSINTNSMIVNGVSSAFFEAPAMRQVCVELPSEDRTNIDRQLDNAGHLQMSLYGTRDAAMNWQEEVAKEILKWGFTSGKYNPCLYWHEGLRLTTMVHRDDVVSVGTRQAVEELRQKMEQRVDIKTQIIGAGPGACHGSVHATSQPELEVQKGRVLNRLIRWTKDGWEVEPDQRHDDIIVHELQLHDARAVNTPGEPEAREDGKENAKQLSAETASHYRALSAGANYLAADRTDIMYAVKEICRSMSSATVGS